MKRFLLLLLFTAALMHATTWYVDGSATGTGDGLSWANACTTFIAIHGKAVASGDTVYVSGGSTGNSQTYNSSSTTTYPGQFFPPNGTTWKIGQDSAHNGTAIFDVQGATWLQHDESNVTISGDAGDGQRHFVVKDGTGQPGACNNNVNFLVEYVDFGRNAVGSGLGLSFNPGTNIEISHCKFYANGANDNIITYGQFSGTGYAANRFHDNVMTAITSNGVGQPIAFGPDFVVWVGSGVSVYNNTMDTVPALYYGGQHQDGFQSSGGSYLELYNNRFTNIPNYCIFPELPTTNAKYTHVRIYNNICVIDHTNGTQAIAIGVDSNQGKIDTDVTVANNLADGYALPFTMRNPITNVTDPAGFVNCYFENNIDVNTINNNIIDAAITSATNSSLSAAQGATDFTSYTVHSISNDYHLLAAATALIATGTNASSLIGSLDKDGVTRTVPWDRGPYKFIGSNIAPVITLNPVTQSVLSGANVTFTATASGTPTPTWQWNKDAVPIGGATSSTLVLFGVTSGDNGTYTATATNAAGSATSSGAVLTVTTSTTTGTPGTPVITGILP